jgi:predicted nucleic acid-binding protein
MHASDSDYSRRVAVSDPAGSRSAEGLQYVGSRAGDTPQHSRPATARKKAPWGDRRHRGGSVCTRPRTRPLRLRQQTRLKERLFVDTSAWFAYANRHDPDHGAVRKAFREFEGQLATSNFIFDETISLCLHRLGHDAARRVGSVLLDPDTVDLICITPEGERAAWILFCRRADQRYSFTDCTSFELMRRLRITAALALDYDFRTEGFRVLP